MDVLKTIKLVVFWYVLGCAIFFGLGVIYHVHGEKILNFFKSFTDEKAKRKAEKNLEFDISFHFLYNFSKFFYFQAFCGWTKEKINYQLRP